MPLEGIWVHQVAVNDIQWQLEIEIQPTNFIRSLLTSNRDSLPCSLATLSRSAADRVSAKSAFIHRRVKPSGHAFRRAYATMACHCGTTVIGLLAWLGANSAIEKHPWATYQRAQTSPGDEFPPKPRCLHASGGKVEKWDPHQKHSSHRGATNNGRSWIDSEGMKVPWVVGKSRPLFGGSWPVDPRACHIATHCPFRPDYSGIHHGLVWSS